MSCVSRIFRSTTAPRGPVKAVDGVSFTLRPGERLGLIGESGSGKTTMGTALMRLTRPQARIVGGSVFLDGRDLLAVPERELRHIRLREIALVPQGAMNSLNPVMRIREQILDAIVAHEGELPQGRPSPSGWRRRSRGSACRVALADRFPHELSGGQKQRVAIAIATVLSPKVIVADEPTSALDVVVQRQVMHDAGPGAGGARRRGHPDRPRHGPDRPVRRHDRRACTPASWSSTARSTTSSTTRCIRTPGC